MSPDPDRLVRLDPPRRSVRRPRSRRGAAVAAALAGLLVTAAPSPGQDALGSGNALDANSQVGRGGVNAPSPRLDFRARNLIVTGDVPGGRGFRGSVGYRAAGDFEASLGSDDLFEFRALSALSAPGFVRYGRTAERFRFGEELGALTYRRSGAPSSFAAGPVAAPEPAMLEDQIRLDRLIQSTSVIETPPVAPTSEVIGARLDDRGRPYTVTASSLRGVRISPGAPDERPEGLSEFDWLSWRRQQEDGESELTPGEPFEARFDQPEGLGAILESNAIAAREAPGRAEDRVDDTMPTEYDRILEEVARRYASAEAERSDEATGDESEAEATGATVEQLAELKEQYDRLRERLQERLPKRIGGTDDDDDADDEDLERERDRRPIEPARTADGPRNERLRPLLPGADTAVEGGIERFGVVLRHGERVERLATGTAGRFNELVETAEERLRRGEYFWAERRFIRALRFIPGHPLATAGLGHAQIGAGLYDSAALTLRSLFVHQPEMIDARYGEGLLPNRVRLLAVLEEIRTPSQMRQGAGSGFLLAYIGHQLEESDLVREGLERMAEADPDDPLLDLLRDIWMTE